MGGNLGGVAGRLLSGWQLGGIASLTSGAPFSADSDFLARDGAVTSRVQNRADLVPGGKANPVLGGPDMYFDVTQFQVSEPGFYGNVGRNTMTDPGVVMVDLSLTKKTNLTETVQFQFRAEFFNILNRANFGTPASILFDGSGNRVAGAGRIRTTTTTSRQIQFGLRLTF